METKLMDLTLNNNIKISHMDTQNNYNGEANGGLEVISC